MPFSEPSIKMINAIHFILPFLMKQEGRTCDTHRVQCARVQFHRAQGGGLVYVITF